MRESQIVTWVYDSDAQTLTAQIQDNGTSIIVAKIVATVPSPPTPTE